MKLPLVLVLALSVSGCEKSSNVGKMTDEATGIAKAWTPRFDELGKRADHLTHRDEALGAAARTPDAEGAKHLLTTTASRIGQVRSDLATAPQKIAAAAAAAQQAGNADPLNKLMNEMADDLRDTHTELTSDLDAAETWIAYTEIGARAPAPPAGDTPPPPPPTDPLPPEAPGAAQTEGAAAPPAPVPPPPPANP